MTCIVGIAEKGSVWLGCDSQTTTDGQKSLLAQGKLRCEGEIVAGVCGMVRHVNIVQYVLKFPPLTPDLDAYMASDFAAAWRACLKDSGLGGEDADGEEKQSCSMLIGVRDRLYMIDSYFGVSRSLGDYAAIGSGEEVALGSLCETEGQSPEKRIMRALCAAQKHSGGVSAPFYIKCTGNVD